MKIIFNNGNVLKLSDEDAGALDNILQGSELKKYLCIRGEIKRPKLRYLINMDNVAYIKADDV